MKTYAITVNTAKRFEPAYYLHIGNVQANSKDEAKKLVEEARKYATDTENVKWIMNIENDLRTFVIL